MIFMIRKKKPDGEQGVDWKPCKNPNCQEFIIRKDCASNWHFQMKRYHEYACRDRFYKYCRAKVSEKMERELL